jgi:hypothetical protein
MTLALSAVVFRVGAWLVRSRPWQELGRLAYFPIPDRDHLQRSLCGMVILGSLLAACLVPAYAGIAAFEHLSIWQIAALVLCVCLQLVYGLALVVTISPHIRYYSWQQAVLLFGAIGLMILALCANGFSEHLWRHWHTLAAVVLATPIGWTNAAIAYGVIGGHWWGWLFLLPLPLAVAAR